MIAKLRTEAKHAFETNETNFKLRNNEAFGKTIENVSKHGDINLVNGSEELKKSPPSSPAVLL